MMPVSYPKDAAVMKGENNLENWADYQIEQLYRSSKDQTAHQLKHAVS